MTNPTKSTQSVAVNPVSVNVTDTQADPIGSHDDVAVHQAAARLIAAADVRPCRVEVRLAIHNAIVGRDAVLSARDAIEATGFRLDIDRLAAMDSIGRAITHTARRSGDNNGQTSEVIALQREGRPLRRLLLSNARSFGLAGRCSAEEVKRIARGIGPLDAAQDLVDLAILYTNDNLVVVGGPVTAEQVARAAVLGNRLVTLILPNGVLRPKYTRAQREARALRDRLWTLMLQAHAHVAQAGGALWGHEVHEHVPRLQSRDVPKKRTKTLVTPDQPTG